MPALGILTCEILELEFAHLLISDPEIQRVTVVEEKYSQTGKVAVHSILDGTLLAGELPLNKHMFFC